MKYKIGLLFILLPVFALSQTKVTSDSLARITLNDLIASWTLGIDSSTDVVDIRNYNRFKNLFDENATVDDDLHVYYRYDPKKKSGRYEIKIDTKLKTFDVYAHDVALQVKSIRIDSVVTLGFNTSDQKNMIFTIKRTVTFEKPGQYVIPETYMDEVISSRKIEFENKQDSVKMADNFKANISKSQNELYKFTSTNTLRITMALETDTVRIKSIKNISNEVVANNDADQDAILDQEDSLKERFGDFSAQGLPDYDLDGVPDDHDKCKLTFGEAKNQGCPFAYFFTKHEFNGFLGWQLNTVPIKLPELNQMGYRDASGNDAMDVLQSHKGTLKNPGALAGVYAGGSLTYYFGQQRKQRGISIGFTYSSINAQYKRADSAVYTYKSSDGINAYRRQVTISDLTEEIKYNVFNFPVTFNYRLHLDKKNKSVINLRAGPSLMVFVNTSNYNASIDIGGLYQIDAANGKIIYNDYFDTASKYNLFLTSKKINTRNPNPGANNVFNQLGKNYDFEDNKSYNGKQHLIRATVAFNAGVDLEYKISEGLTIKLGPHLAYAPLLTRKEKYKPVDGTSDEYQSIYKSNTKSSYSAYGIDVGFVYNF